MNNTIIQVGTTIFEKHDWGNGEGYYPEPAKPTLIQHAFLFASSVFQEIKAYRDILHSLQVKFYFFSYDWDNKSLFASLVAEVEIPDFLENFSVHGGQIIIATGNKLEEFKPRRFGKLEVVEAAQIITVCIQQKIAEHQEKTAAIYKILEECSKSRRAQIQKQKCVPMDPKNMAKLIRQAHFSHQIETDD